MTVTKKDLDFAAEILSNFTGDKKIVVEYAYGKPRMVIVDIKGPVMTYRDFGPRVSKPELYRIMSTIEDFMHYTEAKK